jgi:two-component system CheB/CheR fusion protein
VGAGADYFEPADRKHKIYRRKQMSSSQAAFGIPREHAGPYVPPLQGMAAHAEGAGKAPPDLQREADRLLLNKYVPAAVVINEQLDILQIRGRVGRYLELASGKATLNLLKMAKSGWLLELQRALEEAKKAGALVRRENLQYEMNGEGIRTVNVEVIPFQAPLQSQRNFIIVFDEAPAPAKTKAPPPPSIPPDAKDSRISQLTQELTATKEYLQSIIEALEASNEELQSANEEILSGNEELQRTNQELQTSKEELESANEELNTVNDEMQHRNFELTQLNNDLVNLLASVSMPIVMLDASLNIRRVTPQTEEVLGILPTDVGRPLRHVRLKLSADDLERQMLDVITNLQPRELQVPNGQNQSYRLRITPYRTLDNRIEGVVLVFLNNSGFKGPSSEKNNESHKRKGASEASG